MKYVLLALIGSTGAAAVTAARPATTLGPGAIVQPNGGVLPAAVLQEKKDDTKKDLKLKPMVQHRRHTRRHSKVRPSAPKKDGGKS